MQENPTFYKKLEKSQKISEMLTKIFLYLNFIAYLVPPFSSVLDFILTGSRDIISPILIPYTDLNTNFGYFLNVTILTLLCMLAFVGFSSHDGSFLLYGYQCVAYVDILSIKLDELSESITQKSKNENFTTEKILKNEKIKKKLVEILKVHEDYEEFKRLLEIFGGIPSFVAIFVNMCAICLPIIGALKVSFIPGIIAALTYFFQLAIPCIIGNLISLQNERLSKLIYDMPWYDIDVIETKKIFLQFLVFSQQTRSIKVTMLGVLDNELLTKLVNTIYTYCTVLLSLL